MKRLVVASLLGAILFFILDSLHVWVGIWKAGAARGVPWWFSFVYFGGIFGVGLILRVFERRHALTVNLPLEIGAFVAILLAHLLVFRFELLLTALTTTLLAVRLLRFRQPGDGVVVLVVVLTDLACELALSSAGVFTYSHARFATLPLWLIPMWGGIGLSIRRFFRVADRGRVETNE